MLTKTFQFIVTLLASISHNAGERNGITVQLRREGFVQKNGKTALVPVVSGNSLRGQFRDIAAMQALTKPDGSKAHVDAETFNFLFSGGSLESTSGEGINLEAVRELRGKMPIIAVMGGSVGSVILPGKLSVGKMIPVCKETMHLLPEPVKAALQAEGFQETTIWEYSQEEFYTRRDDTKEENRREYLTAEAKTDAKGNQMMYNTETLQAGTKLFWEFSLTDASETEENAFLTVLDTWYKSAHQVGGNGRIGMGKIRLELVSDECTTSDLFAGNGFVAYKGSETLAEDWEKGLFQRLK